MKKIKSEIGLVFEGDVGESEPFRYAVFADIFCEEDGKLLGGTRIANFNKRRFAEKCRDQVNKMDQRYNAHFLKIPFLRRCKLKLYRLRAKFNVFLQNNKLLWKPPTVAILGMWAFTGAIGLFGHISGQIELSMTGEAESNIVSVIVVICFVSFWGYWFMRIFGEYKEPTDYKLYYSRAILPISFTSPLICIFGLVSGFMVFVMMGQADYFNNLTSTLLLKPKSTFFAAGIILASYTVLGIILNTCSLIIRKIKKY